MKHTHTYANPRIIAQEPITFSKPEARHVTCMSEQGEVIIENRRRLGGSTRSPRDHKNV